MEKSELVALIKNKREFREIDGKFVEEVLDPFIIRKDLTQLGRDAVEKIVKTVRARLREVYGAFLGRDFFKREKLLHMIKSLDDIEGHKRILELHISSRERLPFYKQVYENIFRVTGRPDSILDLGCGLNPFSIPFMGFKTGYYAGELVRADVDFLQEYFTKFGIDGKAFQVDLTKIGDDLPHADVCFMFKILDTLETLSWDITASLLEKVKARYIVASFSTKSLGGRKVIKERGWFERLLERYVYEKFEIPNEVFYVIKK